MNDKGKQFAIVLGSSLILVAVLVGVFMTTRGRQKPFPAAPVPISKPQLKGTYSLSLNLGEAPSLDVKLRVGGTNISATAVRLVYTYENQRPFRIKDADPKKDEVQAKVNSELLDKSWVYPINKIIIDEKKKEVALELALVNLDPAGYVARGEETIATIEFLSLEDSSKVNFKFDSVQTKLIAKNGEEVRLNLVD